jgi:Fe-S-cluster containining protein
VSIYQKVRAVEKVFHQLEKDVATFQQATQLGCISGCGLCCHKPDINASPLEFLPFAYHLYKTNKAMEWYERLSGEPSTGLCAIFTPFLKAEGKGFCSAYAYRGMICRLFGFSAMLNQQRSPVLVSCKPIKESQPEAVAKANSMLREKKPVPLSSNYYFQLRSIDPTLGTTLMPINQAILLAIKTVLAHYAYPRKRPA